MYVVSVLKTYVVRGKIREKKMYVYTCVPKYFLSGIGKHVRGFSLHGERKTVRVREK
jgi:hypothetical protein